MSGGSGGAEDAGRHAPGSASTQALLPLDLPPPPAMPASSQLDSLLLSLLSAPPQPAPGLTPHDPSATDQPPQPALQLLSTLLAVSQALPAPLPAHALSSGGAGAVTELLQGMLLMQEQQKQEQMLAALLQPMEGVALAPLGAAAGLVKPELEQQEATHGGGGGQQQAQAGDRHRRHSCPGAGAGRAVRLGAAVGSSATGSPQLHTTNHHKIDKPSTAKKLSSPSKRRMAAEAAEALAAVRGQHEGAPRLGRPSADAMPFGNMDALAQVAGLLSGDVGA